MSHSVVLVIGPKASEFISGDIKAENWLEEAMAPFNEELAVDPYFDPVGDFYAENAVKNGARPGDLEDQARVLNEQWGDESKFIVRDGMLGRMTTYNPRSRWDWYQVGGRWSGFLRAKPGTKHSLGRKSLLDNDPDYTHGNLSADVIRKGDVDWEGMVYAQEQDARENEWPRFRDMCERLDTEKAAFMFGVPVDITEEEFIARHRRISTFAVLKDGEWYERGRMGWWGVVSDEKESRDWDTQWMELVQSVDDDTVLFIVDVHI